jgi:hypothetical protein
MSRRWTMVLALVAGLALATGGDSLVAAQGQTVTLNLGAQNSSGITGNATITAASPGKVRVEIRANGAGSGPQPAHIHEGTCANLNPAPKLVLMSLANGASTTEVDGSLQQLTASPHAINLHKSPDELPTYIACADIRTAAQSSGQPANLPSAGEAGPAGQEALLLGLSLITLGGVLFMRRAQRARRA